MRQYVGARYVPKFATPYEWSPNTSYEPLTIVEYLGNSYTSKVPVPAGVLPTNSEYWVNTGNYNAGLEEVRGEVNELKTKKTFPTLLPSVYRGDFFTNNMYPQSCCVNGDDIYVFTPVSNSRLGSVRKFSRSGNQLVAKYDNVFMDHANSCCYWEGKGVCVAADYYVSGGNNVGVPAFYLYAPDFSTYTEFATNGTCQGISYDHVNHKLYYMNTAFELYVYNENTELFDYFGKIIPKSNTSFRQGLAINDDEYIIGDISGAFISGKLERGNMYPTTYGMCAYNDVENRFLYHEVEDMEFDSNGNLWGTRFYRFGSGILDCFVVNYLSDYSGVISFDPWTARSSFPWLITPQSVSSFRLPWGTLRNVQQFEALFYNTVDGVRISTDVNEDYEVTLTKSLNIDIRDGAEWHVRSLQLRLANFEFYQNDTRSKLTVDNLPINAADAMSVSFTGPGRLITNNDDENSVAFINVGTGSVMGRFRLCPKNANGVPIKWSGHNPPDGSLMIGDWIALDF